MPPARATSPRVLTHADHNCPPHLGRLKTERHPALRIGQYRDELLRVDGAVAILVKDRERAVELQQGRIR